MKKNLGSLGVALYELCRGIDHRPVEPNRIRKSVSVECTFQQDLPTLEACEIELPNLLSDLKKRLLKHTNRPIRKQFIKIKFNDFQLTTAESTSQAISLDVFKHLLSQAFKRQRKPVRLLGLGITFAEALPGDLQQVFNW